MYKFTDAYGIDSDQPSQGESNSGDGAKQHFAKAEEGVMEMLEHWENDADWHLVLAGILSAVTVVLIAETIQWQDQRPDNWANPILFLERHTASRRQPPERKTTHIHTLSRCQLPLTPSGFVVRQTTLWLLCLTLSTLCVLFETWVHRWALRFFVLTDPMRRSPEKREQSRRRAFLSYGVGGSN